MIPRRLRPVFYPLRRYYYPIIGKSIELPEPERSAGLLYSRFVDSDDVVIEVGARIGGSTLLLSDLVNHVYSFEPVGFSFRMLKEFTRNRPNVTACNFAVGDRNGLIVLNLPPEQDFPYVASIKRLAGYEYQRIERARMIKLDDFHFSLKPTALIVDCEGNEAEVLDGAKLLIPKLKTILIETHELSDGSETEETVRAKLLKYGKFFKVNTSFVDRDGRAWILALNNKDPNCLVSFQKKL